MIPLKSDLEISDTCFFMDYEACANLKSIFIFQVVDGEVMNVVGIKWHIYEELPLEVVVREFQECEYPLHVYRNTFGGNENTTWFELTADEVIRHIIMENI